MLDGRIRCGRAFDVDSITLGIPHTKNYHLGARPIPLTDPGTEPIREVLA